MSDSNGLSPLQFTLITGTFLIANLAAFWFIRRNFFKSANSSSSSSSTATSSKTGKDGILSVEEWSEFELIEKEVVTHNTAIYRFALPTNESILPIPIGQHIQLAATWNEKEFVRPYTPITLDDTLGHFDLLVKTYPLGNASQYLASLSVGAKVRFRGPKGRFLYKPNMAREVGMIAGGTGITPILQVIKAILRNPADKTKIYLIFANLSVEDILLHEELKGLAEKHADQLKVHFVLNTPPSEDWTGSVGYITADIIKTHGPSISSNEKETRILMCGPPPMMSAMTKILTEELAFKPQSSPPSVDDQIQRF